MIRAFTQNTIEFNEQGFIGAEKRNQITGELEAIGPQILSAELFLETFVNNDHRIKLFNGFVRWLKAIKAIDINLMVVWFGGSFVEQNSTPNDIDVLVFYSRKSDLEINFNCLRHDYCESKFGIDLRTISINQNPIDVIHQVAQYTLFYSHPTYAKNGLTLPFKRKAVVSILGHELNNLCNFR